MIVSGAPRDNALSLTYILAVLDRRRYWVAIPTLAGLAIGLASYASTPNSFVSEAVVALDARRVALPTESVVSPLPQDSPVLRTEIDIISSRSMAAKVVARLEGEGIRIQTEEAPRFSLSVIGGYLKSLFQTPAQANDGEEPEVDGENRFKIDRLLSKLRVNNDGRSYTIFLTYSASDPVFAAKVANAYALSYLDHQIEIQRTATRRVSDWLGETLGNLRADLEEAEQAAENFRQKAGLIETDGVILQAQRVSTLNTELANTRASAAGLHARLDTIKALSTEEQFPSLSEILSSEMVQTLRVEQARIERRLRELEDSKAVKSMELSTLRSELESTRHQVRAEVTRIVASLSNEISVAQQKENTLQAALRDAQQELATANHAEVTLAQLEREAAANRTIYESYLVRYKQTIEQDSIAAPEAQIISFAEPAGAPAKPRLAAWIMFGLGLGGTVGAAATVLREATDRRSRLVQSLESATGVPVIGVLPQVGRNDRARIGNLMRDTSTAMGRSLFSLRRALQLTTIKRPAPLIAITSLSAGDGKTTLALGIARSAAACGMKAVVVDGNLRRPGVEPALRLKANAYLDELVDGERDLDTLSVDVPGEGFSIVAARRGMVAPELLLASPRFPMLLSELRRRFDLVLILAPEVEAASDATEIAASAGRLLFVTRFEARHAERRNAAIRELVASGQKPEGIILTYVDRRSYGDITTRLPVATAPRIVRPVDEGSIRSIA